MPKPSAFARKMQVQTQARVERDTYIMKRFTIQQCLDIALIVLNDTFGFGPKRARRFAQAFNDTFSAYIDRALEDGRDDPDISYTIGRIERDLKRICGDGYVPFEERYSFIAPEKLKRMR